MNFEVYEKRWKEFISFCRIIYIMKERGLDYGVTSRNYNENEG